MSIKAILIGQLIDGTGNEALREAVIITEKDRIVAVGKASEIDIPAGAEVIDATAHSVIPGLMDVHWHLGGNFDTIRKLRMALNRGITTIGTVSGGPAGCVLRDAIKARQVTGCADLVVGCIVNATHGHVKGRTADGPWEVRKAVREMAQAGCDFIKTAASGGFWAADENCSVINYTPEEMNALVDEAHAWGKPVAVHAHTQPGLNYSIDAGADMIHHGCFIDEEALQGIAKKDLFYIPTLRVTSDKNINAWPDRPWMMAEMRESQPIHRAGVRRAHELGIKIGLGTDGPGSAFGWEPGDATPWELMELALCGLSNMEVLVAATRTTADAMNILDEVGTLEVGKKADLVVLGCDPLVDVTPIYEKDNVLLVMKNALVESVTEEYRKHAQLRR